MAGKETTRQQEMASRQRQSASEGSRKKGEVFNFRGFSRKGGGQSINNQDLGREGKEEGEFNEIYNGNCILSDFSVSSVEKELPPAVELQCLQNRQSQPTPKSTSKNYVDCDGRCQFRSVV